MQFVNQFSALVASATDDIDALLFQYGLESSPIDQIDRDHLDALDGLAEFDQYGE